MSTPQTEANKDGAATGLAGPTGSLLPCPFCGGNHIPEHPKMAEWWPMTSQPCLEELAEPYEGSWRVCCYGCGVQTWNNLKYTREQAIAAWNTRSQANT